MQSAEDFSKVFERLKASYAAALPEKLAELATSFSALKAAPADRELLQIFHRQAHSLTGSGASYGYPALSQAARQLEAVLLQALSAGVVVAQDALDDINCRLQVVSQSVHDVAPQGAPSLRNQSAATTCSMEAPRHVLIVDTTQQEADALGMQLSHFGYLAKILPTPADIPAYIDATRPEALILSAVGPEEAQSLALIMAQAAKHQVPVLFVAERGDLPMRLAAVRGGAVSYFTKPIDVAALVDQLDELHPTGNSEPYRILIVDDQPIDAALYASALDSVGMITHIVNEPDETLNALRDFNPELVLLDMYMPEISGEELAKIIRQQSAYVSVPLVFLSAETDVERQLAAMRNGADDFLTKPINLQHLVASVTSRAKRYRSLRSFMQRDSLTGLLNHTKSKEFLDVEVARAERDGWPLSFAMVDIDHFKRVNDTFGHPVGDQVIKSLARLLQQRLRRSDIIGRYGGEEFAVILSNTSGETAARVMDELRETFSLIPHRADTSEFVSTFSCGVVQFQPGMSTTVLASEADKALYQAKRQGRNQVVLA
jgi:diguanylate cyclase (GGDEF)-like protein